MKTSNAARLAIRAFLPAPRIIRRIPAAVSDILLVAVGLMSFAWLVGHWEALTDDSPPAAHVDSERQIDFRGRDAGAWEEYSLMVGQAAGVD